MAASTASQLRPTEVPVAILRDAVLRTAPQDEVGKKFNI
jgi:hypothetical protein